jgi:hypothetical protein
MRRWLTILLLVFMPLQSSWAVAAGYCTHHEESQAAQHFGHHADEHHAGEPDGPAADGMPAMSADLQNLAEHAHGHHHHGGFLGLLTSVSIPIPGVPGADLVSADVPELSGVHLVRIERPNWFRLA